MNRNVLFVFCVEAFLARTIHGNNTQAEEIEFYEKIRKRAVEDNTTITAEKPKQIQLKPFAENLNLHLNPYSSFLAGYDTPVYLAKNTSTGVNFYKYTNVMKTIQNYMGLPSKYLPDDFVKISTKKNRRSSNKSKKVEKKRYQNNRVYKNPETSSHYIKLKRSTIVEIPNQIYPELLIVVDYELYVKLGKNVWNALPYILTFWNSVDMKYRSIVQPNIRLNIAGIVFAEDPFALRYIANNTRKNGTAIALDHFLHDCGLFWYEQNSQIPINSYDALITMTSKSLCNQDIDLTCSENVLGIARFAGACKVDHSFNTIHKMAMVIDKGGYDGVSLAAHELGHLLGSYHDQIIHNEISCSDESYNTIMRIDIRASNESTDWSECSLRYFQKFLETKGSCLFNKPEMGSPLPGYLGGKFMSVDQQCKMIKGTGVCSHASPEICNQLNCAENNGECNLEYTGVVDGAPCGVGKFCFHSKCINERESYEKL